MVINPEYRQGVCAVIVGKDGRLLLGERAKDPDHWQLPQGGIEPGETIVQALHREVEEEIGVTGLKILKQTNGYFGYQWPPEMPRKKNRLGQEHVYFLLDGSDIDISKLSPTKEFCAFRWASVEETLRLIIPWKKNSYVQAFQELGL